MTRKKKKIGWKVTKLLLASLFFVTLLMCTISMWGLHTVKQISTDSSKELGQTAAQNAEESLEKMAGKQLQMIAMEKAGFIEEKYKAIEAYVHGITNLAETIYESPEKYPNRPVDLPQKGNSQLSAQLLKSAKLQEVSDAVGQELLKLGNIQDLLVQYNKHNDMVSSTYIATKTGWMIQADYIAYSKYEKDSLEPKAYEAAQRPWYQKAVRAKPGEVIYTQIIRDIHLGGECIVSAQPVYHKGEVVAVVGVGSYLQTVNEAVLNTKIGEKGYAFLVNEEGQIIVSPQKEGDTAVHAQQEADLRESSNLELAQTAVHMVAGEKGICKLKIDGKEVYLAYAPLPNLKWSFATVMGEKEVVAPAKKMEQNILNLTKEVSQKQSEAIGKMLATFVVIVFAATILICIASIFFTGRITEPIRLLTKEVARMDERRLGEKIQIKTGDEVEELGNAFNEMTAQIQNYIKNVELITAEKERIKTEIQVASRLQADMLPDSADTFLDRTEFILKASMIPAKGVGGDFYDFFLVDEDHLALVMADVSGKGVPAALFMVLSRTLIRSHVSTEVNLETIIAEVNEKLCRDNKNGMFVTAWVGILTISTGKVTFVNAGHCNPLVQKADGACTYESMHSGFVLAGMEGSKYRQGTIRLQEGDTLFLYTDGVTEATNCQGELYGEGRLKECMIKAGKQSPQVLLDKIWEDVLYFQGEMEQFDDITMLGITYQQNGYQKKSGEPKMEYLQDYVGFVEQNLPNSDTSLLIAVDEIYSNICYYSHARKVTLGMKVSAPREISIYFEDDGTPYNPMERPDPDIKQTLGQRKIGGLGIYLIKKQMDQVSYEYADGKNRLQISKIMKGN